MIRTANEQAMATRRAREWRDQLRRGAVRQLCTSEALELAHVLDELQHFVQHATLATGGA